MVDTGSSIETVEGHGRRDFCDGKSVAATGIRQAWRDQGRVGGGEHRQRRLGVRQGTLVYWERYR